MLFEAETSQERQMFDHIWCSKVLDFLVWISFHLLDILHTYLIEDGATTFWCDFWCVKTEVNRSFGMKLVSYKIAI